MKKITLIAMAAILFVSPGCDKLGKLFNKKAKQETEALQMENRMLQERLAGIEAKHNEEITTIRTDYERKLLELQKQTSMGKVTESRVYYVVVGSFKNMDFAREYAGKIQSMGYEGKIVDGPNQFNLVTSGTYQNLKSSLSPLNEAREKVSTESWVYFK